MSSTYYLLCMSHNPATTITELGDPESIWRPDDLDKQHPNCDFVITRLSGGLVEVGCPGVKCPTGGHNSIQWAQADWLRILSYFEPDDPRPDLQKLFKRNTLQCWSYDRLYRLRYELEF